MDPDGSHHKVIDGRLPHPTVSSSTSLRSRYWTKWASLQPDDGSHRRADLRRERMQGHRAPVGTFSPKQIHLDKATKRYWVGSRRDASPALGPRRVTVETCPDGRSAKTNAARDEVVRWNCRDPAGHSLYWTQIRSNNAEWGALRAGIESRKGGAAANRSGRRVFFNGLPRIASEDRFRTSDPL